MGTTAVELLLEHLRGPELSKFSELNRKMAHVCLNMPLQDADGRWIIHYLGKEFEQSITKRQHHELYSKAREFVVGQLNKHRAALNTKLALRYDRLLRYFDLHGTPRTE